MPVFLLSEKLAFPYPRFAREDGLLAVGGDLDHERILLAYELGIFPWYSEEDPILWWSPDPRLVLYPNGIRISRSLRKTIRQGKFEITMDKAFGRVIRACAESPRRNQPGTWIVDEMIDAYIGLHELGYAHSVEAWCEGSLAGGLYGISLGGCFFGESMFTRISDASKTAFVTLVRHLQALGFDMIDCQIPTGHLKRFGAIEIPRKIFLRELNESMKRPTRRGRWRFSDTASESAMA